MCSVFRLRVCVDCGLPPPRARPQAQAWLSEAPDDHFFSNALHFLQTYSCNTVLIPDVAMHGHVSERDRADDRSVERLRVPGRARACEIGTTLWPSLVDRGTELTFVVRIGVAHVPLCAYAFILLGGRDGRHSIVNHIWPRRSKGHCSEPSTVRSATASRSYRSTARPVVGARCGVRERARARFLRVLRRAADVCRCRLECGRSACAGPRGLGVVVRQPQFFNESAGLELLQKHVANTLETDIRRKFLAGRRTEPLNQCVPTKRPSDRALHAAHSQSPPSIHSSRTTHAPALLASLLLSQALSAFATLLKVPKKTHHDWSTTCISQDPSNSRRTHSPGHVRRRASQG